MITFRFFSNLSLFILFIASPATYADWFDWTNTEVQYLHGSNYQEPFNPNDIGQSLITVTHSDGWAFGRNFFFMDTLFTENGQPSQTNIYGEAYSSFTLGKILKKDLSFGIFKDLNATVGVNVGENLDNSKSGVRIALYGATIDFNLPYFKFFSVDILNHVPLEPSMQGSSIQITPVWNLPFSIANTKWSFEGFLDFIGSKKTDSYFVLAQPQLRLDIGDLWGESGHFYAGIEYQYWHNKYGIKGLNDNVPQALLVWKF
jgi:nucleoside-specific outer membrane channel protein Tsx